MSFKGHAVRVKVGSQVVVDPGSRGLAGLKLYNAFLDGPQDLFIGDEGNSAVRPLWAGFGGTTSLLYSMYWIYPLRPCRSARFVLTGKKLLPRFLSQLLVPVAHGLFWTISYSTLSRGVRLCSEGAWNPVCRRRFPTGTVFYTLVPNGRWSTRGDPSCSMPWTRAMPCFRAWKASGVSTFNSS